MADVKELIKEIKSSVKNCEYCEKEFIAKRSTRRFCSDYCTSVNWAKNNPVKMRESSRKFRAIHRKLSTIEAQEAEIKRLREILDKAVIRLEITEMAILDDVIRPLHANNPLNLEAVSTCRERINATIIEIKQAQAALKKGE